MILRAMADNDDADAAYMNQVAGMTLQQHEQSTKTAKKGGGNKAVALRGLREQAYWHMRIFCAVTKVQMKVYGIQSKQHKILRDGLVNAVAMSSGGWQREIRDTVENAFFTPWCWSECGVSTSPERVQLVSDLALKLIAERAESQVAWEYWYPDCVASALHPQTGRSARDRIARDAEVLWRAERLAHRSSHLS